MGIHTSFRHLLIHFSPLWVVGAVPLGLSVGTFCRLRKLIEGVLLGHIQTPIGHEGQYGAVVRMRGAM